MLKKRIDLEPFQIIKFFENFAYVIKFGHTLGTKLGEFDIHFATLADS